MINIKEILEKHKSWLDNGGRGFDCQEDLDNAIKEICEELLKEAANKAALKMFTPIIDGCHNYKNSFEIIDKQSILNTINQLNFD